MPEPIEDKGYEDIRDYIMSEDGWTHLAPKDEDGDEPFGKLEIHDDDRLSWETDPDENPLLLELVMTGEDEDVEDLIDGDSYVTITGARFYANEDDEDPVADRPGSPGTLAEPEDQILSRITVEYPLEEEE